MAVPESYEDYLRRTGTREAMEERQSLRQQGLLNAPLKGPRGLSACCKYLRDHGIVVVKRLPVKAQTLKPMPADLPHLVIPTRSGEPTRKSKWTARRGTSSN